MIVSRQDIQQILKGEVGEVVRPSAPAIGETFWVRETARLKPACMARVVDVWPVEGGWAVLLERVPEAFTVPDRPRPERPALRLTRVQRAKLFDGECPHIGGTGACPVKAGETVHLSSRVTLRVFRVDVQRGGKWKLMYELADTRDQVRLLRRTPPTHREGGAYEHPTAHAIREAGEQSSYTSSPRSAVSDAGEAPPRAWMEARAKAVGEFHHQKRLAAHAEKMRDQSRAKRARKAA